VKWNAVYKELIEQFGSPFKTSQIQVRGNLQTWIGGALATEVAVVAYLTLFFKDGLPALTLKQNDNPDQESEYSCSYYKLEIDGVRVIEVDAFANIFFVMDEDQLATYRANLGF
jgi:P2 family phage contractile tail tube protein